MRVGAACYRGRFRIFLRAILVHNYNLPVLKTYKFSARSLLAVLSQPAGGFADSDFIEGIAGVCFSESELQFVACSLLKFNRQNKGQVKNFVWVRLLDKRL
jgi:hypothetical protein